MSKPTSAKNAQVQSWEERFDEDFTFMTEKNELDMWLTNDVVEDLKQFIQQEINQAKLEMLDEVGKIDIGELDFYIMEKAETWKGRSEDFDHTEFLQREWFASKLTKLKSSLKKG